MTTPLQERFRQPAVALFEHEISIVPGCADDYTLLAEHHYRAHRPATMTRILVARHPYPTVVARYLGHATEVATIGVLVESLPALCCRLRDFALGDRYRRLKDATLRARALNAELRCISRVIVHPQWRGLGLAQRLVRAALASPTTCYTEALAAMGQVHPFFERAGMTAYRRPPHAHDARLIDALQRVGISAVDVALLDDTDQRINALPNDLQRFLDEELRRWHRKTTRTSRDDAVTRRQRLAAARQRLNCQPVYYLVHRPSFPHTQGDH